MESLRAFDAEGEEEEGMTGSGSEAGIAAAVPRLLVDPPPSPEVLHLPGATNGERALVGNSCKPPTLKERADELYEQAFGKTSLTELKLKVVLSTLEEELGMDAKGGITKRLEAVETELL